MNLTGEIIPCVRTELDFEDLNSLSFTTYSRLLDKQLCQYLALNKDSNLIEALEKETLQTMLSINIYSINEEPVKISNCKIRTDNKVEAQEDYTGCIILQTKTKNDISIASVEIEENLNLDLRFQYKVGDLLIAKKGVTFYLPSIQDLLVFTINKSSKAEWIDAIRLTVKPTR